MLPGMWHPRRRIEVEGGAVPPVDSAYGQRVASASVAANYFQVADAPILSGRGFHAGDVQSIAPAVVVNEAFVRQVLGGRNAIGRRVRYAEPEDPAAVGRDWKPGPWREIVGVVKNLGMSDGSDPKDTGAGMYHLWPRNASALYVMVHVQGDPASFAPRLRRIAIGVDAGLHLDKMMSVDKVQEANLESIAFWFRLLIVVSAIALLLSLAGIYAVMAFTVSRRTREIGVRMALGSDRRTVLLTIFARPLRQIGLGILAGSVIVAVLVRLVMETLSWTELSLVASYAVLMTGVCMLACVVPTRRALRIEPTEALRAEA
jgi:putative ABC transport system permease protein